MRNRINTNGKRERDSRRKKKYVRYDSKKFPIGFNAKRRFQIKPI